MNLFAIDLGGTNVKMAVPDSMGNPTLMMNSAGEPQTRSVVYLSDPPIVGTVAMNAMVQNPPLFVANWKAHMGTEDVLGVAADGREFRAADCARILLQSCKEEFERKTGEVPQALVVSVPANFNQAQLEETQQACESDGGAKCVANPYEPSAALWGNGVQDRPDGLYLIADSGGTTLDTSLAEKSGNSINVIATRGIQNLGSCDVDALLVELGLGRFEAEHGFRLDPNNDRLALLSVYQGAEQCKHTLSRMPTATMVISCRGHMTAVTISQDEFRALCTDWIERTVDCVAAVLDEGNINPKDLRESLLVGGGSFTLGLREAIERRIGITTSAHCEPIYAAAFGCVLLGRMELDRQNRPLTLKNNIRVPSIRHFARDLTAHDIGATTLTSDHQRLVNSVILRKNTAIPCDQTVPFQLAEPDEQKDARIELLQGDDGADRDACHVLGHFDLLDLPVVAGLHRIDIRCRIDRNGKLRAWAQDAVSGKTGELTVDYKSGGAPAQAALSAGTAPLQSI